MPGPNANLDYQAQLLYVAGLLQLGARVVAVADDLAVRDADFTLVVQRSPAGPSTIPLPAASGLSAVPGSRYLRIFDGTGDAATNNITIAGTGALINGAASIVVNQNWGQADLEWMGTYWRWHQGASSSGSLTAHAPTHRAGGTDDLLSEPGDLGGTTAAAVNAKPLRLQSTTVTPVAGITHVVGDGGTESMYDSAGNRLTELLPAGLGSNTGTAHAQRFVKAISLASGATYDIAPGSGGIARVASLSSLTYGAVAFASDGTATTNGLTYTNFSTTIGTPAKVNVGKSGSILRVENNLAGTEAFLIAVERVSAL